MYFIMSTSHAYVQYVIEEKKKLALLLRMEDAPIMPYSVLVGHEYLQQKDVNVRALTLYDTKRTSQLQSTTWKTR